MMSDVEKSPIGGIGFASRLLAQGKRAWRLGVMRPLRRFAAKSRLPSRNTIRRKLRLPHRAPPRGTHAEVVAIYRQLCAAYDKPLKP